MVDVLKPTKVCTGCGEEKPSTAEFFHRKLDGLCAACKVCLCAKANARYRENPRKVNEQHRRYYREHREETIAYQVAYRAAHKEEMAERDARYRVLHKEQVAENNRQWKINNRDRVRELTRAGNHRRRARRLGQGGNITSFDIAAQYKRQRGKCFWRDVGEDCAVDLGLGYHVDHVMPLLLGGSNWPENLVLACPHCNQTKGAKHPMDFAGVLC
jgi:5-methylcytosine-specific restriction endonuclease McrA